MIDEQLALTHIDGIEDEEQQTRTRSWVERKLARLVFFVSEESADLYDAPKIENLFLSRCYSCKKLSIWLYDAVLWPKNEIGVIPNLDMPSDIQRDFLEAADIVDASPRGAAALLRLALQKLCVHLGEKGKSIDTDIASLVSRGLDIRIQQALDIVRVVGNESVHPGQLDMRDDKATALQLFDMINAIVEAMIAQPNRVATLYERLPQAKRDAIATRDKAVLPKPSS